MEQKKTISISLVKLLLILVLIAIVIVGGIYIFNNYFTKQQDQEKDKGTNSIGNLDNNTETSKTKVEPDLGEYILKDTEVTPDPENYGVYSIEILKNNSFAVNMPLGTSYIGKYKIEDDTLICKATKETNVEGGGNSESDANYTFEFEILDSDELKFKRVDNENFGLTIGKKYSIEKTSEISVVPTMQDTITGDSSWCGTFQLIWNDMKNDVVKQDIEFTPQEEMVRNLNKEEFTENMISEDYYYKKYGLKTLELKEEIEKGIKEKFNQESDILGDFNWTDLYDENNPDLRKYFFYVMLYRKFEFMKQFDKLENGEFGEEYDNIEYFGIDEDTNDEVGEQIDVLYYTSQDDFAIKINTKTNDEVIFCKNPTGENFKEIYENMNKKAEEFTGNKNFEDLDDFKAPKINLDEKREYKELENKQFLTADSKTAIIEKAIQTIKFSLDEKGGEIKSEAGMEVDMTSLIVPGNNGPRHFYVDDTFAIFLKEKGKDLPYFAGKIEDITKFQ